MGHAERAIGMTQSCRVNSGGSASFFMIGIAPGKATKPWRCAGEEQASQNG